MFLLKFSLTLKTITTTTTIITIIISLSLFFPIVNLQRIQIQVCQTFNYFLLTIILDDIADHQNQFLLFFLASYYLI